MNEIEKYMGKKIRYTITGFTGICTAVTYYRTGEYRLMIEANDSTGRPCEWWIDTKNAEVIEQDQAETPDVSGIVSAVNKELGKLI